MADSITAIGAPLLSGSVMVTSRVAVPTLPHVGDGQHDRVRAGRGVGVRRARGRAGRRCIASSRSTGSRPLGVGGAGAVHQHREGGAVAVNVAFGAVLAAGSIRVTSRVVEADLPQPSVVVSG